MEPEFKVFDLQEFFEYGEKEDLVLHPENLKHWKYLKSTNELKEANSSYSVDLDCIKNICIENRVEAYKNEQVFDWIMHLHSKTWVTPEALHEFIQFCKDYCNFLNTHRH